MAEAIPANSNEKNNTVPLTTIELDQALRNHLAQVSQQIEQLVQADDVIPLVDFFVQLKRQTDVLQEVFDDTQKKVRELAEVIIPGFLIEKDEFGMPKGYRSIQSTKLGYTVSVSTRTYASVKPDFKGIAFDWLREQGYGDVITETVHAATLPGILKEIEEKQPAQGGDLDGFPGDIVDSEPPVPDYFNITRKPAAQIRVKKGK